MQSVPGGASLKLTNDTELRVSFLYDADRDGQEAGRPVQSYLLFKYSLDYRLLSNLQVGISGYLYNPRAYETSLFRHQMGNTMGVGPVAKYDLGHWSFLVQSQTVTDRGPGRKDGKLVPGSGTSSNIRHFYLTLKCASPPLSPGPISSPL